jgi:hypothetical protein
MRGRLLKKASSMSIIVTMMASGIAMAVDSDLLRAKCLAGAVTVTTVAPWHTNSSAPWAWDKGSLVSKDQQQVKFKGSKCEGIVKAFIANGNQLKGPILIPIR